MPKEAWIVKANGDVARIDEEGNLENMTPPEIEDAQGGEEARFAQSIDVSPQGRVWIVSGNGVPGGARIKYRTEDGEWLTPEAFRLSDCGVSRIAGGYAGSLWFVNMLGEVWRFFDETLRRYSPASLENVVFAQSVTVGRDQTVAILSGKAALGGASIMELESRDHDRWRPAHVEASARVDCQACGNYWAISAEGQVMQLHAPYTIRPASDLDFAQVISVGNDAIWIVSTESNEKQGGGVVKYLDLSDPRPENWQTVPNVGAIDISSQVRAY